MTKDSGKPQRCIIIAAHDASEETKARADFVCDGIEDQIELNIALGGLNEGQTDLFREP